MYIVRAFATSYTKLKTFCYVLFRIACDMDYAYFSSIYFILFEKRCLKLYAMQIPYMGPTNITYLTYKGD